MEFALNKELALNKQANRVFAVFFSVVFISLGAFVRIPLPFTPVPITLQTFFVLLSVGLLGRRLSLTAQTSYIFLGALGLPIFTGASSGLSYLVSPTAGYLLGFVLAALFSAVFLKLAGDSPRLVLGVFLASSALILLSGSLWLKFSLGLSFPQSLFIGFIPFIVGDFLKAMAAAFVYSKLKTRAGQIL
jgi:biotin transport system substrate-specific component